MRALVYYRPAANRTFDLSSLAPGSGFRTSRESPQRVRPHGNAVSRQEVQNSDDFSLLPGEWSHVVTTSPVPVSAA